MLCTLCIHSSVTSSVQSKASCARQVMTKKFWLDWQEDLEIDVDGPRNIIMLQKKVERAFDCLRLIIDGYPSRERQ